MMFTTSPGHAEIQQSTLGGTAMHEIKAVTFRSVRVQRNGVRYSYRVASVHCTCGLVNERQSDWYSSWSGETPANARPPTRKH